MPLAPSILSTTTADGTSAITYDADSQITAVTTTSGTGALTSATYAFDLNGNAGTPQPDNQATPDAAYADYGYDTEGNVTGMSSYFTGISTNYAWDSFNRMKQFHINDDDLNYSYNGFNQRVERLASRNAHTAPSTTYESYIYDGDNLVLVLDENDHVISRLFTGQTQNQILAQETPGTTVNVTLWAITDMQGSVHDVVNYAGDVQNHIIYDALGNLSQSNTVNVLRDMYQGMQFDTDSTLNYAVNRYELNGRWLSQDPLGLAPDSNPYRAMGNSALNFTDAIGLSVYFGSLNQSDSPSTQAPIAEPIISSPTYSPPVAFQPVPMVTMSEAAQQMEAAIATSAMDDLFSQIFFMQGLMNKAASSEWCIQTTPTTPEDFARMYSDSAAEQSMRSQAINVMMQKAEEKLKQEAASYRPAATIGQVLWYELRYPLTATGLALNEVLAGSDATSSGIDYALENDYGSSHEYVDLAEGSAQGFLNSLNGVTDVAVGLGNLPFMALNYALMKMGSSRRVELTPAPNWSKGFVMDEYGTQKMSKLIGGQAILALLTLGLSSTTTPVTVSMGFLGGGRAASAASIVIPVNNGVLSGSAQILGGVANYSSNGSDDSSVSDRPTTAGSSPKTVYNGIKSAPKYPEGFTARQGGLTKNPMDNKSLLDQLRQEVELGKWQKVYKDGYDAAGNKVSIHYFESPSGKVFDVDVWPGWSNE